MPTNLVGLSRRGAFGKTRRSTKQSFSFEFPTVFLVVTEIIQALGSMSYKRESNSRCYKNMGQIHYYRTEKDDN